MQGNTDVAYCQAASEPVAYRLVFDKINNNMIVGSFKQISETGNKEVSD